MKSVIYLTILSCLISSLLGLNLKIKDDFKTMFQVKQLQKGDNQSFGGRGDRVQVHYTGTFPETGKVFDSSRTRGQPFTFRLGAGEVIKCWDMVVAKMSLGERLKVVCPSNLAYGTRGAGRDIPPNANIAFDIEMLGINN